MSIIWSEFLSELDTNLRQESTDDYSCELPNRM